jgi:multidrug resistance protein, MATE family
MIKSTGNQGTGAIITMSAYWAIGVPLSWYLGIHKNGGLVGVWIGPIAASIALVIVYTLLIMRFDW